METEVIETTLAIEDVKRKSKFTGKVVKVMLAGAIVDIGLENPGVVHISQLQNEAVNRVEDVVNVGQTVEVWVKRVIPKKKRIELTMIEPLALEWRDIKDGQILKGTVTRLEKYGAFVEIGAERSGLVHISELAHGYIRTPSEAVKQGDTVDVIVLKVNRRKKQIKLSIKALLEDPTKIVQEAIKEESTEVEKPVPTAMEIALREAMDRSQSDENDVDQQTESKKESSNSELDSILSRTLQHKVNTTS
jgi:ribosomal protein S1